MIERAFWVKCDGIVDNKLCMEHLCDCPKESAEGAMQTAKSMGWQRKRGPDGKAMDLCPSCVSRAASAQSLEAVPDPGAPSAALRLQDQARLRSHRWSYAPIVDCGYPRAILCLDCGLVLFYNATLVEGTAGKPQVQPVTSWVIRPPSDPERWRGIREGDVPSCESVKEQPEDFQQIALEKRCRNADVPDQRGHIWMVYSEHHHVWFERLTCGCGLSIFYGVDIGDPPPPGEGTKNVHPRPVLLWSPTEYGPEAIVASRRKVPTCA